MRRPVVIREALKESGAVKRWSEKYLDKIVGHEKVLVNEILTNENEKHISYKSLSDFFMMKKRGMNVSILDSSSIFVFNNGTLVDDLASPIDAHMSGPNNEPITSHQLFSATSDWTRFKADIGVVIFRQIVGIKQWELIDTSHNLLMCPVPGVHKGSTVTSCLNCLPRHKREEWIDRVPRSRAVLYPGDVLVSGSWWWYGIGNADEDNRARAHDYSNKEASMIGVASRIKSMRGSLLNSPIQTLASILWSDKLFEESSEL